MTITQIIEKYLTGITTDEFHRYKSWDNCYKAFRVSKQTEIHTLELAFYLASWGMYRGSSGLLQKNHLIHKGAVDILFSDEYRILKCDHLNEVNRENIKKIIEVKNKLADHYGKIYFSKGGKNTKPISATDTLLSKIILGTLSCAPAYDRYFIDGLKEMKMKNTDFDESSLNELFDFSEINKKEIVDIQRGISTKIRFHYPLMKIVDMYFWQIGYDKDIRESRIKRNLKASR